MKPEIADFQEKETWALKFKAILYKLKNLEKLQSTLLGQHKWGELLNLKKKRSDDF